MTLTSLDVTADMKHRIETREARIGIVGMGYVGLPLALLFSEERFAITGFDIDARKVETLNEGESYIVRIPGSEIQSAQTKGFLATADYARIADMDVVIICVPTPLNEYHEPDLSYVTGTVSSLAPYVHEGQLIILESTTYPGTTEDIVVPLLEKGNLPRSSCFEEFHWLGFLCRVLSRTRRSRQRYSRHGEIFQRLWEDAARQRSNWRRLFIQRSSTALCRFQRLRRRR